MADDWKYAVAEFEDESDGEAATADGASDSTDGRATDVFGEARSPETIEPGSPSFENALFVALGVALAVLVLLGV